MEDFFPARAYMEEVLGNSYRDFHVKGFDYICLRRSPTETIKLYFFDGDVSKLPEVVNPHDHRYNFDTLCVTGAVENILFRRDADGDRYERFEYRTPLNGGNGFSWVGGDMLKIANRTTYRPGERYAMGYKHIHTIRMAENETVIALVQFEDRVALHAPTFTYSRDRDPPGLTGLYRQFKADEIKKRLATLRERAPNIRLPEVW